MLYCPDAFAMPESDYDDFIQQHPLAVIQTRTTSNLCIAPLIYNRNEHCFYGHLAKANDFLSTEEGEAVQVIFSGEQAYISASWYPNPNHVPTWNYRSLVAQGSWTTLDKGATQQVLEQQTATYETAVNETWTLNKLSSVQIDAMLAHIVGFRIAVESWQGKAKLSQNHPKNNRQALIQGLQNSPAAGAGSIARLMQDE